ncbi:MAG TPA: hypothetical protein VGN17_24395 [Bryobacteraceae bacterium]
MRTVERTLVAVLAVLTQVALAQTTPAQAPESPLLDRIRAHMMDTLKRQPNYTCLETVERSGHNSGKRTFEKRDTLRLEVALVDGKEMFAWPGSKKFDDRPITEFVPGGMFGNGDFATYASTVFGSKSTQFQAATQTPTPGNVRFDYEVAAGLQLRMGNEQAVVGYHGSIYADPQSLDVLRLEVVVDQIPPRLRLLRAADTLEYMRLRIGDADFLLPAAGEIVMTHANGAEDRNRIKFSTCHEFSGESVLSFDEPAPDAPTAVDTPRQEAQLPPNTNVTFRLLDELDTSTASIGDPLRAELASDISVKGKILFPKGTPVTGRISQLRAQSDSTVLGMVFLEIESAAAHARLELTFQRAEIARALLLNQGPAARGSHEPHEGVIVLRPGKVRLPRGTLVYWKT